MSYNSCLLRLYTLTELYYLSPGQKSVPWMSSRRRTHDDNMHPTHFPVQTNATRDRRGRWRKSNYKVSRGIWQLHTGRRLYKILWNITPNARPQFSEKTSRQNIETKPNWSQTRWKRWNCHNSHPVSWQKEGPFKNIMGLILYRNASNMYKLGNQEYFEKNIPEISFLWRKNAFSAKRTSNLARK